MTLKLCTAARLAVLLPCMLLCCLVMQAQVITTWAGNGSAGNTGDGYQATLAQIDLPTSILADQADNLYICDLPNHRIRKVSADGTMSAFAGTGAMGYAGDNAPASAARLNAPWGICQDGAGYFYITDQNNWVVRRVSPAGTITTFAGNNSYGYSGDGGPALNARLKRPVGIAASGSNIYVGNIDSNIVRRVSGGTITRFAGTTYGYTGDGASALLAKMSNIYGMTTDAAGNLYVADAENHVIRKITPAGIISTYAGNGLGGFGGDNGQATSAQLQHPIGVYMSPAGDLYIADYKNHRIRKVTPAGIITTVAGNGAAGYNGDNIAASSASLNYPMSVTMDSNGDLYIADKDNHRIRKVVRSLSFTKRPVQQLNICLNAGPVLINQLLTVQDFSTGSPVTWSLLSPPASGTASTSYTTISTGSMLTPAGMFYTAPAGFSGYDTFKVKVTNGALTDSIAIQVYVSPLVLNAGTITGDSQVCVGSSVTLANATAGGLWVASNHSTAQSVLAGNKLAVTGLSAGTDTVRYTVTNTCGTATTTRIMIINPLPAPGLISGATTLCVGTTATLQASVPGGIWSSSNALVTLQSGSGACLVSGIAPGTSTVRYTTSNAYCVAITSQAVEVQTFPVADSITGPAEVCTGAQVTLASSVPGGSWNSGSGNATVLGINLLFYAQSIVTGVAEGPAPISYSITNSCGTTQTARTLTVNPRPAEPLVTQRDGYVSVPDSFAAYQWLLDGMPIPGATASRQPVTTNGYYTVKVSNTLGCTTASQPYIFAGCSADDLRLYPNPATTSVHIEWCQPVTAHILAADGRLVSVQEQVKDAGVSHLPPGVYMLVLFDQAGTRLKTLPLVRGPG